MKKTLVALSVAAFAASANAVTVLDAEGTKVDFEGSLRLIMEKTNEKTKAADGTLVSKASESKLRNAGSRFGVKVKHQLGEDFYALGRVEFRFNKNNKDDQFGDLYAHRAYVGLGSKQFGEIAFGRQVTIADDLSQTNDYEYGLIPKGDYIPTSGTQVVRYDYRGIEGLQLSANYNFNENDDPLLNNGAVKNAIGVGALYSVGDADVRFAYGHTNYETNSAIKHRKDGYLASASYAFGDFTVIGDFGYAHEKVGDSKLNKFYVSPGFKYQVVPTSSVYGNYLYERVKTKDTSKEKTHGFLLGVDYKFHKQVVAFVEGKVVQTKAYNKVNNGYEYAEKTTDKAIGVGMRVYW
ncbi:outer membrane protein P2-like protein [Actinobacillus minor NM305]|uniref:Outer membrane protein P2-like protein n=1 Tax=Actinobacillus minor NM305 TaxID=637911 RepID=C5S0Q8_9PAST|nr:porin [Actinobacillus minor]EER47491.1 outer membrane protein P2-like protein [Actinobacillus minor NM305]